MSDPIIEVWGLQRAFGDFMAVRGVTFAVERGEIFGYLGANGAGKSTTIRMLCGLLQPTAGNALVAGAPITGSTSAVKARIGYMSQRFSLYLDLPVKENLAFFGGIYGLYGKQLAAAIDRAVDQTQLGDYRQQRTGALPGGIRQRLALACAVLHGPQVLFLDEPTAGVDPMARRHFWGLIRDLADQGTTMFVTTHYMDEAEYCRRVGLMVDGALLALDTPAALKARHVPGPVIACRGTDLSRQLAYARGLPQVRAADLYGLDLHLRLADTPAAEAEVLAQLRSHGADVQEVQPMEASLEDVFLALVDDHDRAARRLP